MTTSIPPVTFGSSPEPQLPSTAQPFTELITNTKGSARYVLGPDTAIYGLNQRGKTSALDAVIMALLGYHPLVSQRSVNDYLTKFAPPGEDALTCILRGPAGDAKFEVFKTGRKYETAHNLGPLAALSPEQRQHLVPMLSDGTLFDKKGPSVRRSVFAHFSRATTIETPPGLTPKKRAIWEEAEKQARVRVGADALAADVVEDMVKWLGSENQKKGVRRNALLVSLEAATEEAAGAEQLPELEAQHARAVAWEAAAFARTAHAQLAQEYKEYEARAEEYRSWAEDVGPRAAAQTSTEANIAKKVAELRQQAEALNERREQLSEACENVGVIGRLAAQQVAGGAAHTCFICASSADVAAIRADMENRFAVRTAQIREEVEAPLAKVEAQIRQFITELDTRRRGWQAEADQWARELRELQAWAGRLTQRQKDLAQALAETPPYEGPSAEDLQVQIKALKTAQAAAEQRTRDAQEVEDIQAEQTLMSALRKDAEAMVKRLLTEVKDEAEAAVNFYMPASLRVGFDVDAGQWQIAEGTADDRPHAESGSGMERATAQAALLLGWTREAKHRYIVLDEEHLGGADPWKMRELLDRLTAAREAGEVVQNFVVIPPPMYESKHLEWVFKNWTIVTPGAGLPALDAQE